MEFQVYLLQLNNYSGKFSVSIQLGSIILVPGNFSQARNLYGIVTIESNFKAFVLEIFEKFNKKLRILQYYKCYHKNFPVIFL